MKNIHVLPTDKPSRLLVRNDKPFVLMLKEHSPFATNDTHQNQNIYITNDEEIKEGDYGFDEVHKCVVKITKELINNYLYKKIILTTDAQLIKDGVQAIDDEFLEWFVKNPSCEFVKTFKFADSVTTYTYKIIIPQEESKQETLEEAAKEFANNSAVTNYEEGINVGKYQGFIEGAKWQQEQDKNKYSKEEVFNLWNWLNDGFIIRKSLPTKEELLGWFKQFKKK